ncbi:hypothetical protein [Ferroacidibacillus organovorans]|nr:hypothetical protein [Ferroacidibacillus organovorans]
MSQILGLEVPRDFPSEPVREFVLPMTLDELGRDPSFGQWSGRVVHVCDAILIGTIGFKTTPDELGNVEIGAGIVDILSDTAAPLSVCMQFIIEVI